MQKPPGMFRRVFALLCGALLSIHCSRAPDAPKIAPEMLDALQWFSELGFPSVKGMRPVKVWTGGWFQRENKKEEPCIELGFLAKEDGERFTAINTDLIRREFVQQGAPLPEYARVFFEGKTWDEIAGYFLNPGKNDWGGRWSQGPWPLPREKMFILGWCCWQNGRDDLAAKFLAKAKATPGYEKPDSNTHRSFREIIAPPIAYFRFQLVLRDFGNPSITRTQLVANLHSFVTHFPNAEDAGRTKQLITGLQELIAEEKDYPPQDKRELSKLPPEERAKVLVARLRDYFLPTRKDENDPYDELAKLGEAAVPALIEALDDHRPTRWVSFIVQGSWMGGPVPGTLRSIGDVAQTLLSCAFPQPLTNQSYRGPLVYSPSPPQPSRFKLEAQRAWAEYQSKGGLQYMLDAIAKGGEEAKTQVNQLMRKFPDKAGPTIVRYYEALSHPTDRQNLIYGATAVHDPAWMALMKQETATGQTTGIKAAAAFCLRKLGDDSGTAAMLKEWKDLLAAATKTKDSKAYGGSRELIDFLASSVDEDVITQLTKDMNLRSEQTRSTIIASLADAYGYNNWNHNKQSSPKVKALIEKVLVECLDDDPETAGQSHVGYHDPEVGDVAARCLASILPGKYRFDRAASFAAKVAIRREGRNQWRKETQLEPITPPILPQVPDNERNTIKGIVFAGNNLEGTTTRTAIENLKGQPLRAEDLVRIVCDFGSHLPKGANGLRIRAVRNAEPNGVALKVWSSKGEHPEVWMDFSTATEIVYDQERVNMGAGGTCSHQDIGKESRWAYFVENLNKTFAQPADKELIVRVAVWNEHVQ